MLPRNKSFFRMTALVLMTAILAVLMLAGCANKNGITVPEGLTREEQALFMAVAKVCPKNDNHSKAEYLTFYIEGWSFSEIPQPILTYLMEYCAAGGKNQGGADIAHGAFVLKKTCEVA